MIKNIQSYFLSSYELVDSRNYYLKLSILMGLVLTVFVFLFDPYDNSSATLKYDIPMRIVQIGYGLNLTLIIYFFYCFVFLKMGFKDKKRQWKTYQHWLLLVLIFVVAGFLGTIYHRLIIDVGKVDLSYYALVTVPRSILISSVLFTIDLLLDKLYQQNKRIESLQKLKISDYQIPLIEKTLSKTSTQLKSPIIKQSVTIEPQNITYIKAFGNYVEIHLKNEKKARLLRSPLHSVANQLNSYSYIRKCHRKYYINIAEVEGYKKKSDKILLKIKNSLDKIPVSRNHTKEILFLIENF